MFNKFSKNLIDIIPTTADVNMPTIMLKLKLTASPFFRTSFNPNKNAPKVAGKLIKNEKRAASLLSLI